MANEAVFQQLRDEVGALNGHLIGAKSLLTDARGYLIDLKALVEAVRPVTIQNWPSPPTSVSFPSAQPVDIQNLPNPLPTSVGNFPAAAYPVVNVQRAFGNLTATGAIVAAQGAGVAIRVVAAILSATAVITVKWQGTADVSGSIRVGTAAPCVLPQNPHGWAQTAANAALTLAFVSGTGTLSYHVLWVAV